MTYKDVKGLCCSRRFLLAWFETHCQVSQALQQKYYVCFYFSYKCYLWNRSFFSSFLLVQKSLITLLLGTFGNHVLCCYLFGGRTDTLD